MFASPHTRRGARWRVGSAARHIRTATEGEFAWVEGRRLLRATRFARSRKPTGKVADQPGLRPPHVPQDPSGEGPIDRVLYEHPRRRPAANWERTSTFCTAYVHRPAVKSRRAHVVERDKRVDALEEPIGRSADAQPPGERVLWMARDPPTCHLSTLRQIERGHARPGTPPCAAATAARVDRRTNSGSGQPHAQTLAGTSRPPTRDTERARQGPLEQRSTSTTAPGGRRHRGAPPSGPSLGPSRDRPPPDLLPGAALDAQPPTGIRAAVERTPAFAPAPYRPE
jgi:hypothetical protein